MIRPLRSAPTASSRNFTATTGRSACAPRDGTQLLAFQTLGGLPLAARFRAGSVGARLPTFRTKAAGQAHATSAPGTTWPVIRATARLIPGQTVTPGSDATSSNNDASTVNPARDF